jgi:hypothetical protein
MTDALVVAGSVWKCSGIAVQLNVNCFYWRSRLNYACPHQEDM